MKPAQLHTFARRAAKRGGVVPMTPELFAAAESDGLVEGTFNKERGFYEAKLTPKGQSEAAKLRRNSRTNEVVSNG